MAEYLHGERIAKGARLAVGCCASIIDPDDRVLLVRRADNGRWCLPGGMMDSGESPTETCVREVKEETGLDVEVEGLIGVYSTPHRVTQFADGNRYQFVTLGFRAHVTGGVVECDEETLEIGYFSKGEFDNIDIIDALQEWKDDVWRPVSCAILR